MITTVIINLLAVFFAWLESNRSTKYGLKISMFIIFLFLALRYDFGSDYFAYFNYFISINQFISPSIELIKGNEFGWFYLNRLFGGLGDIGFFAMTAGLAAFSCYVIYRFIKKYIPQKYYWFAVFLYTFQTSQMLILVSAMRQAVAVSLFILAIDYIIKKKVLKYLILILIATLFHTSAAILFPFILLAFVNWTIKWKHLFILFVLFMIPILFVNETFQQVNAVVNQYFIDYTYYTERTDFIENPNIRPGFILNVLIYFVIIYYSLYETDFRNNILFKIIFIFLLIVPLGFSIQLIGRLNFYLLPAFLVIYPNVFDKIKNRMYRTIFTTVVILFTLYTFHIFFNLEVYQRYKVYYTIFSSPIF